MVFFSTEVAVQRFYGQRSLDTHTHKSSIIAVSLRGWQHRWRLRLVRRQQHRWRRHPLQPRWQRSGFQAA